MADQGPHEILLEKAQADGTELKLVSEAGFAAKLVKCQGPMKKYNGTLVKPQEIKPGQFEVKFEFKGEKVNLVLPGKCFQVVVDFVALEELESAQQETKKKGNHFQGNNRGNAKIAVDTMVKQVKEAIKRKTDEGQTIQEVFKRFDENGNGELDINEFLAGCIMLKVNLTKAEAEMIWPVITMGKGGQVKINRFIEFVEKATTRRKSTKNLSGTYAALERKASAAQDRLMLQAQAGGRESRIRRASVSVGIRESVKRYCQKNNVTAEAMFAQLDDDGTGVINQKELFDELTDLKFTVTKQEISDIWPMINVDGGRQITAKEWAVFIEGRTADPKKTALMRKRSQSEKRPSGRKSSTNLATMSISTSTINMRKTMPSSVPSPSSSLPAMANARRASASRGGKQTS